MSNRGKFISSITAVLAAAAISAGFVPITANAESVRYDVNGDGTVDTADASEILAKYALAAFNVETSSVYDVNGDGTVDTADAALVLSIYASNAAGISGSSTEVKEDESQTSNGIFTDSTETEESVEEEKVIYDNFLFVGDSRTVGMSGATGVNAIAKVSMGYSWAKKQISQVKTYDNTNIVFWFGVNDLYNISKYITMYNDLYESMKDKNVNIYVMAVTPCCYSYSRLNPDIASFNTKMQAELNENIEFIDTYSFLNQNGFGSSDGLHYNNITYRAIYNYVISEIKK